MRAFVLEPNTRVIGMWFPSDVEQGNDSTPRRNPEFHLLRTSEQKMYFVEDMAHDPTGILPDGLGAGEHEEIDRCAVSLDGKYVFRERGAEGWIIIAKADDVVVG